MRGVTDSPYQIHGALTDPRDLVEGGLYEYRAAHPEGCAGCLYRLHRIVLDVPSYQHKVLVEALTGHDAGLWFVCSVANFCTRYVPAAPLPVEPGKVAGYITQGSGA